MTPNLVDIPRLADIPTALSLLTRLPLGGVSVTRGAAAAWAWPLAGAVTGGLAALVMGLGAAAGLGHAVTAGLALATGALVTGAMHEDGLADTADGFWGGWSPERRLEIMRDSAIGTYGVMALLLVTGLRWGAIAGLAAAGHGAAALVTAAMVSRAMMAPVASALPHARTDGLSARTGQPSRAVAGLGLALAGLAALLLAGGAGLCASVLAGAAALATAAVARAKIGGQTGDVLGAAQQVSDLAALLALAALLG